MQRPYGWGQETSTLEHQAQESVAECGDNCICVQLDGFDIIYRVYGNVGIYTRALVKGSVGINANQ